MNPTPLHGIMNNIVHHSPLCIMQFLPYVYAYYMLPTQQPKFTKFVKFFYVHTQVLVTSLIASKHFHSHCFDLNTFIQPSFCSLN